MLSARQRGTAALAGAIGLGLVLFGVDQPGFAASGAAGGLTVSVVNYSDWGAGFSDGATVKNTGGSAVTGWNIQFDLDSSEAVTSSTGVTYASSGTHYTLTATGTAATLAPGASVLVHFKGTENAGHYIAPTNVTVAPGGGGGSTSPATPTGLAVSGTTASSISLAWTETDDSDPAVSYRVLEGSAVVASPTATSATVGGLAAASTHTYTVEAVDAAGVASSASSPVTATTGTTGGGGGGAFTQSLIDSAVAAKPFAWAAPTSGVPRPGTGPSNIAEAKVLYYLALVDKAAPGSKATNGTGVQSALLAQIRSLIAGGHEPDADGGLEMWGQAPVAQALLLLKNDGPAWSQLSSAEQNKVSLVEAAMGYGSNYAYNDANNFDSGICGYGNFAKTNNPNYRDGGVDTEIAAIQYFGASTWDGMLSSFNDATFTAQLNAAGLTSAGQCFAAVGSGGNSAIARPFVYAGHGSSDLMGIWGTIAGNTFDKTAASTVSPAHIADNTTSPYDGQCCMGHEFNSTDSSGLRSSALYVFEGWMNVTGARVAMEVLGNFNASAASTETAYHIGTLDLKYKLDHGYVGQALNQDLLLVDDHGDPSGDGPNDKGFLYDWDAYTVAGAPAG
ncbi:hypothetical protein ABIA35_005455 [Catenulispora sp. MAP12-49]|uniref:cellulose binding domain-containing protein n=1 Tax=Catenulispora sp. MAP12-49 TaxID=3156302 RepID=UPI003513A354